MTLDLQPAEMHRYTIDIQGATRVPVHVVDNEYSSHHLRTRWITPARLNGFHLRYVWPDESDWDVVVPPHIMPTAVIQRDAKQVARGTFRFFRTWRIDPDASLHDGPIFLKSGLWRDRLTNNSGGELATSRAAPWAIRLPIEIAEQTYRLVGGLIAAAFVLMIGYRHLVDNSE